MPTTSSPTTQHANHLAANHHANHVTANGMPTTSPPITMPTTSPPFTMPTTSPHNNTSCQPPSLTVRMKKNQNIIEDEFQKLVRVFLRRLLGEAYLNRHDLKQRYTLAIRKIITRRRSNHLQWWRRYNKHKNLRYRKPKRTGNHKRGRSKARKKFPRKIIFDGVPLMTTTTKRMKTRPSMSREEFRARYPSSDELVNVETALPSTEILPSQHSAVYVGSGRGGGSGKGDNPNSTSGKVGNALPEDMDADFSDAANEGTLTWPQTRTQVLTQTLTQTLTLTRAHAQTLILTQTQTQTWTLT